jgi:hypothetical protein
MSDQSGVKGRSGSRRGEVLLILGAILLFVGPLLVFLELKGTNPGVTDLLEFEPSSTGYESGDGVTYAFFGTIVLVMAVGLFVIKAPLTRRFVALIAFLAAAVCLYAGIVDATSADSAVPVEASALVKASSGMGTRVVIGGAALALFGAILVFMTPLSKRVALEDRYPPPTSDAPPSEAIETEQATTTTPEPEPASTDPATTEPATTEPEPATTVPAAPDEAEKPPA